MANEDVYYIDEDGYHEDDGKVDHLQEIEFQVAWSIFKTMLVIFGILALIIPWATGITVIFSLIF